MTTNRFSEYKIMWIFVFFDLPTETKNDRKKYALFRNLLLKDGFTMFQFSIYIRHCQSKENANVHINRVKKWMPAEGSIGLLTITDKQFSQMEIYYSSKPVECQIPVMQLELF